MSISTGIQQCLELVDGVAELVCAAEFADDFMDIAVIGYGPDFQHIGQRELQFAVAGVLAFPTLPRFGCPNMIRSLSRIVISIQVVQNFAGFRREEFEEGNMLLFQAVGALTAG